MAEQSSAESLAEIRVKYLKLAGKSRTSELLVEAIVGVAQAMVIEMVPDGCSGYSTEDRIKVWEAAIKSFEKLDGFCAKLERLTKWDPT